MPYQSGNNSKRVALKNDLEGAITDFSYAIHKRPKNSALHYLRGTAYAQLNKDIEAIEDFKIILVPEPTNQTVQSDLKQSEKQLLIFVLLKRVKPFVVVYRHYTATKLIISN